MSCSTPLRLFALLLHLAGERFKTRLFILESTCCTLFGRETEGRAKRGEFWEKIEGSLGVILISFSWESVWLIFGNLAKGEKSFSQGQTPKKIRE